MNYETIDWDTEAKRIMRAFALEENAEFRRRTRNKGEQHILFKGRDYLLAQGGLHLSVIYKPDAFWFKLQNEEVATWVTVDSNGQPLQVGDDFTYAEPLAKGLFHLGLLTPQIEATLQLAVSDGQKSEWARQYETFDYRTMDWDAEAKRVARAFGLSGPCSFVEQKRARRRILHSENGTEQCALAEQEELFFRCIYIMDGYLIYGISRRDYIASTDISLDWKGQFWDEVYDEDEYSELLAKGLFHLGFLTTEGELSLRVSISAHQKMEWTLEHEARYEL